MKWFHAHVYYPSTPAGLRTAENVLELLKSGRYRFRYVGQLLNKAVGPHPLPQFEVHFTDDVLADVLAKLADDRLGLSVLVHPVTPNDHEDHFDDAIWLGEPVVLDATRLDPPGMNKAFFRLGNQSMKEEL